MSKTILKLKSVTKRIEGFSLYNIDITLKAGEVHV